MAGLTQEHKAGRQAKPMRNQSARADLGATARRRQHPLDIVVVILGVCGSSGSATVRVLGQTKARPQTVCISVQLSSVQTAPLVRPLGLPPVRHNEHHCVLSAFVVSCSCLALFPAPLSRALFTALARRVVYLFFFLSLLSPSTFLALVCHVYPFVVLSRCLSAFWVCKKVASQPPRTPATPATPLQLPCCPFSLLLSANEKRFQIN